VTDAQAPEQAERDRDGGVGTWSGGLSLDSSLTKSGRVAVSHARRANSRLRSRSGHRGPGQPVGCRVRPRGRLPARKAVPSGYPAVQSPAVGKHGTHGERVRFSSSSPPCQARHRPSRAANSLPDPATPTRFVGDEVMSLWISPLCPHDPQAPLLPRPRLADRRSPPRSRCAQHLNPVHGVHAAFHP
jgi:hypothetical protein